MLAGCAQPLTIKLMANNSFGAVAKLRVGTADYDYFRPAAAYSSAALLGDACLALLPGAAHPAARYGA